ncbi:MAG: sulfatase [Planctomycetota bacterium]|nr:sulfatase [Planctomycetota bacterium]MDA0933051.1 sulfatase [Planctomycetota bacterium]
MRAPTAVALALCLTAALTGQQADRPRQPHILLILADDLGYADLGCQGSGYYETPALDALAADGVRLTHAYSNGPNCAPTRAALQSGCYAPRTGVYTVGSGARGKPQFRRLEPAENRTDLDTGIRSLAEGMRAAGYRTAHFGKWHLGGLGSSGPEEHGFEVNVAGYEAGSPRSYFSPYRNPKLEDGPDGEYLTDRLTDEVIGFLRAHVADADSTPFYAQLCHYAVHTPIQAKPDDGAAFADRDPVGGQGNAAYAGMVLSLDRSVGRILDALAELGIADRTMVVFASDNGGVGGYGDTGGKSITSNAPLRGGKGQLYEGGVRVPMIVRWPGVTQGGSTAQSPVITMDLFPTFLRAAGVAAEDIPSHDGLDLRRVLAAREAEPRDLHFHFPGYLEASAKAGTWRTTPAESIRRGDLKLIHWFEDDRVELYDLASDPGESKDLSAERAETVRELLDAMAAWRAATNAPMPRRS